MRCILCGALATFRFLAKLHVPLVWQHLAKCLFFQLFMQVIPMALHSFRCWGVNIPSRLKHFFGGPHLLCFRFTAFRNFNLVAFLIGRRTAAGCLHSEYDKKDVQQKSSSEPKIQWQKISSSQTRTKKGTRLRTGYFLPLFFGSVLDFCCTSLFVIFTMKTSFTRLSVICPKLHFAGSALNSFQNCLSVSPCFCVLLRNLNLPKVSFLGFWKHSLQFLSRSVRLILAMLVFGNLSAIVLRATVPNARYKTLIAFFAAGISSNSPSEFYPSFCCFCELSDWNIILWHKGNFKWIKPFSHSNWGCFEASAQKLGSPAIACYPPAEFSARSAMLKYRVATVL